MRRPLIVGNWKMNTTPKTSKELVLKIRLGLLDARDVEIVLCPPFTSLPAVSEAIRDSNLLLGAQNLHWEKSGAYTGEVSGEALVELGCRYVIIGHSERREYFFETDELVNRKMRAALAIDLSPIVCLGERLKEREAGETFEVIERQFSMAFANIPLDNIVIAYEPVWAIGTGRNATPKQAGEVHRYLRELLTREYGDSNIRIIYGGSVKPDNIDGLLAEPDIDGVLVGGASLDSNSFIRIVKSSMKGDK